MATNRDYYEILGISKTASADEIKRAYRKLAMEHHPDKHGGDDAKFKEIGEAYEVLKDQQKRAAYDQYGQAGAQGNPFGGQAGGGSYGPGGAAGFEGFDFSDILNQFMGGGSPFGPPTIPANIVTAMVLSLAQSSKAVPPVTAVDKLRAHSKQFSGLFNKRESVPPVPGVAKYPINRVLFAMDQVL
jgi:DnaJ-class molecular chaperone